MDLYSIADTYKSTTGSQASRAQSHCAWFDVDIYDLQADSQKKSSQVASLRRILSPTAEMQLAPQDLRALEPEPLRN